MMNDDNETCMMKVDENVDDLKDYVGTSIYILKSRNPPIPSRHASNLTMSNFNYIDDNNEMSIMNVDANMDDLKIYVGTLDILESLNPPIPSRHVSSLAMLNFDAYMHSLKKFQRWPHSLLTVRGRCKMTFVMGVLEVPCHFNRVPTNIL
jgi:hypothetical protein